MTLGVAEEVPTSRPRVGVSDSQARKSTFEGHATEGFPVPVVRTYDRCG